MAALNKFLKKQFHKHITQIRKGGFKVIIKKIFSIIKLCFQIPVYPFSIPIIIFLYIIKPFYLVRWISLWSSRIGHFAKETELYCCAEDLKINFPKQKYINIFFLSSKYICNKQLLKMWNRRLIILPSFLMLPLYRVNNFISKYFPQFKDHNIKPLTNNMMRDVFNILEKTNPHLDFNEEENFFGKETIKKFGLSENDKFVCLIVRDKGYLSKTSPDRDWSYHDYRNSNIDSFLLCAEELTKRGYYIFRMGTHTEKKFISKNKMIIDYANSKLRSDFMDIYLGANCEFCISTATGFDKIPIVFRKPIAYTGVVPIGTFETHNKQTLLIFKEHFSETLKKKTSIKEIFNLTLGAAYSLKEYKNQNILLIENTAEQIKDLVIEMDERLNNRWIDNEKVKKLQKSFWYNYSSNQVFNNYQKNEEKLHGEIKSKISSKFLIENEYLAE